MKWLEWDPTGPGLNSIEDTSLGGEGPLSVDYCVPPWQAIRVDSTVRFVWRRLYDGELVEISTASGQQLTTTANHPILTPSGWQLADDLVKGQHVVGDFRGWQASVAPPDNQYVDAPAQQVFDFVHENRIVPGRSDLKHQFNGQWLGEDVDVVAADGLLRDMLQAADGQPFAKFALPPSNVNSSHSFRGERASDPRFLSVSLAPPPRVNMFKLGGPCGHGERSPVASGSGSGKFFPSFGSHSREASTLSKGVIDSALRVGSPRDIGGVTKTASLNSRAPQVFADSQWVDPLTLREHAKGLPSEIALDEIVEIRRFPYRGHVYNLTTDDHWFTAGNIVTHNCQNVDTRFGVACLGPLTNAVSLAAAGGTPATANGFALSGTMGGALYGYVIRGTKWAKLTVSTMTLLSDGTETALAEAATSIVYTKNAAATPTQVIAIGMDNTAYRCITAVGAGALDTHSANNEASINRILALGTPSGQYQRMVGLGRSGAASTGMNTVRANILSATVDADASAWGTVATISGKDLTFTGFGLDESFWILGTDEGPFYLDAEFAQFRELMSEIGRNSQQCLGMGRWSYLGLLIPLLRGLRPQKGLQSYGAVGPERYANNTSPVQGRCQGVAGDETWAYLPFYNVTTGDTYLCAARPRQPEDWHNNLVSYYPIAWYDDLLVGFIDDIDTANGTLTNPTTVLGQGSNMGYITRGRIPREIDDPNYRFASAGTEFLTESRRFPNVVKRCEVVTLTTIGCSATQTVTVKLQVEDILTGALRTAVQVDAPISTNGFHVLRVPEIEKVEGVRVKPQLVFATASSSATPQVIGPVRVGYEPTDLYDREMRSVG